VGRNEVRFEANLLRLRLRAFKIATKMIRNEARARIAATVMRIVVPVGKGVADVEAIPERNMAREWEERTGRERYRRERGQQQNNKRKQLNTPCCETIGHGMAKKTGREEDPRDRRNFGYLWTVFFSEQSQLLSLPVIDRRLPMGISQADEDRADDASVRLDGARGELEDDCDIRQITSTLFSLLFYSF
jgi:hypothetical protein